MNAKKLYLLALVVVLLVSAGAPGVASADGAVVPFKGTYDMSPQNVGVDPNGCNIQHMPGVGQATHLGESTLYSEALACPATLTQSGSLLFTAADGSQLSGHFSGKISFEEFPTVKFWGAYEITDGNGRFDGYTGSGFYTGSSVLGSGKGIITFDGVLVKD